MYELINGQIYYMAPSSRKHQEIAGRTLLPSINHIHSNGGPCKPYIARLLCLFTQKNDKNPYVEPDISVICDSKQAK